MDFVYKMDSDVSENYRCYHEVMWQKRNFMAFLVLISQNIGTSALRLHNYLFGNLSHHR